VSTWMNHTKHTRYQVSVALGKWIAQHPTGVFTQQNARVAVSAILNGSYDEFDQSTGMQIARELNDVLAKRKPRVLVKVPRNTPGPDGITRSGRQPVYWTEKAYAAATAEAVSRAEKELAFAVMKERVYDELVRRGCKPENNRGRAVRLNLRDWYRLLGLDGD
jgi:hypothetical protein